MWMIIDKLPVQLAVASMVNLKITQDAEAFRMLETCAESYRLNYPDAQIGEVYGVQNARKFFHAINIDPTKRRPSSEALLNRALKNKPFHQINSLVDTGNWCSLDFLLPICLYDSAKINGEVDVRKGEAGESYEALNGEVIDFEGRYVIADETGPFGSPMTDSVRTAVSESTQNAHLVIFAHSDFDEDVLRENLDVLVERVRQTCGGEVADQEILK